MALTDLILSASAAPLYSQEAIGPSCDELAVRGIRAATHP